MALRGRFQKVCWGLVGQSRHGNSYRCLGLVHGHGKNGNVRAPRWHAGVVGCSNGLANSLTCLSPRWAKGEGPRLAYMPED